MTSNCGAGYSVSSLIDYNFLFLLALLLPCVKGVLQFGFWVRVWLYWHPVTMTWQFVGLCVSIMLGVRVSSFKWGARWMSSRAKAVGCAGYSQHPPGRLSPADHLPWALLSSGFPLGLLNERDLQQIRKGEMRRQSIASSLPLCFSPRGLASPGFQFLPGKLSPPISALFRFCQISFLLLSLRLRGSNSFLLPSSLAGSLTLSSPL